MRPTLTYFEIRGRAEPIRLLLHLCGVDYVDRHVPIGDWQTMKPTTPFGGLPIYEDDEVKLPQAIAILYYLAEKHAMLGATGAIRSRGRVTVEACRDVMNELSTLFWSPDFATRREPYVQGTLPKQLAQLDAFLRDAGTSGYWAGPELTCADPYAWAMMNAVAPLAPEELSKHAALCAFKARFEDRPDVAAYLASPSRPPTYTLPFAHFGGTPETSGR